MMRALIPMAACFVFGCSSAEPTFRPARGELASEESGAAAPESTATVGPLLGTVELPPIPWELADEEPAVLLEPGDMSTATFGGDPTVLIPARGLTRSTISDFVSGFELVTWPERELVPTEAAYLDEGIETVTYSRLVLRPREPLADRWYAIRGSVPTGWSAAAQLVEDGLGVYVSRFRPGIGPVLQRVYARALPKGAGEIALRYSERVGGAPLERSLLVEIGSRPGRCRFADPSDATAADTSVVRLLCDDVPSGAAVRVRHSEAVLTPDARRSVTEASGDELPVLELMLPSSGKLIEARYVPTFGLVDASI